MAEGGDRGRRAALVYNPIKVDQKKLRGLVEKLSAEYGWDEPLFYETTIEDLGDGVATQAIEAGANAVLVAGGDGTVRAVAGAVTSTGVPLTIVPSGTGNLLARNLNLPLGVPEKMVRATFAGDRVPIDVGIATITREGGDVEEHGFVVMAGMGLDAAMIANTSPDLKKQMGWVAYVDGAARSLPKAEPFRVIYQMDGHRMHTAKVQSVLFANCGALPAGIALIPDASIRDGELDVTVIQPTGPLGWFAVWRRVWWQNSVLHRSRAGRFITEIGGKDRSVRYMRGTGCETATDQPRDVELDGDEFGQAVRIKCEAVAGGVIAVVPKGHPVDKL